MVNIYIYMSGQGIHAGKTPRFVLCYDMCGEIGHMAPTQRRDGVVDRRYSLEKNLVRHPMKLRARYIETRETQEAKRAGTGVTWFSRREEASIGNFYKRPRARQIR